MKLKNCLPAAALCLAGTAFAVAANAANAANDSPAACAAATITVTPSPLVPSPEGTWQAHVGIANASSFGLYLDSLVVDVSGAAPARHLVIRAFTVPSVSGGDSTSFEVGVPAAATGAHLAFLLHAHALNVPSVVASAATDAQAYDPARLFPAQLARVGRRPVAITVVSPGDRAIGTGVLLLRDEGATGNADLLAAIAYRAAGFTVVILDPPGTGASGGPADLCGPATLAAAEAALDTLAHQPGVSAARVVAMGRGRGATTALLLAARHPELGGVIAEGAMADPWATYRALRGADAQAFVAEAGRDSASWRARSPIAAAASVKVPVLLLHGEMDAHEPVAAVRQLVAALHAGGAEADLQVVPNAVGALPAMQTARFVRKFLAVHTAAR